MPPFCTILALMRFPLALTTKIAAYIIGQKLRRTDEIRHRAAAGAASYLQPDLHRLWPHSRIFDLAQGHDAPGGLPRARPQECNAPMVSICGGEPLIYPQIEALMQGLLEQKRIVYICTNAMFMRKKMREWLAAELQKADAGKRKELEAKLQTLIDSGLIAEKDAEEFGKVRRIRPSRRSPRATGCIGTCISMGSSGRTI